MRWDWVRKDHPEMVWMKRLIALHQGHRALRVGDYRRIETEKLFAFERHTDRALDTRLVIANPGTTAVMEKIMIAHAGLMDDTPLVDLLGTDARAPVATMGPGLLTVTVPAQSVMVLQPVERELGGYSRYKRVR